MKKITVAKLKRAYACPAGIRWFKRAFPDGCVPTVELAKVLRLTESQQGVFVNLLTDKQRSAYLRAQRRAHRQFGEQERAARAEWNTYPTAADRVALRAARIKDAHYALNLARRIAFAKAFQS